MEKEPFNWPGRRPKDPAHDLLVAFLAMDIQSDSVAARDLLLGIEVVSSGAEAAWRRIGNLFDVHLNAERVTIENMFDESRRAELSLPEFAAAARAWCDYVGC